MRESRGYRNEIEVGMLLLKRLILPLAKQGQTNPGLCAHYLIMGNVCVVFDQKAMQVLQKE